MPLKMCRFTFD